MLDTGRGCLRETVGEARQAGVQGMEGAGVLHLAAINGSMNVVRYLVETMRFDVDDLDKEGLLLWIQTLVCIVLIVPSERCRVVLVVTICNFHFALGACGVSWFSCID